ncbi:SDR family NAD(P)-dependent oxidoreductase [Amycolatopsis lurida]
MSTPLAGRTAIVSGSSRGIGRGVAERLAAEGAAVVVNGMDKRAVDDTVAAITESGGAAVACVGDVTADGFPEHFVQTAVREFGGLDIVVNNAGFPWDNVIQKTTDEQWDTVLDTHLKAPFRILRAAQPVLREQVREDEEKGRRVHRKVVNVSSIAGVFGNVGQAGYASAKAGIFGLTRTLAKEWGRYRVNVNSVAFGLIDTRLICAVGENDTITVGEREIPIGINEEVLERIRSTVPLGRFGTVAEAAGAIYLFCGPDSDYVTGEVLTCGGGVTI